jgi:heme/copper-type cytochrome/quinol oxidase subunit 2
MAINDSASGHLRGPWQVLAGLFDQAWRHGRKRQSRYLLLLLVLVGIVTATLLATVDGGAGRSGVGTEATQLAAATGARYVVCASNIDNMWRYTYGTGCAPANAKYPRQPYSYRDLIIPAGSRVDLRIAPASTRHVLRIAGLGLTIRASTQSTAETTFRTPRAGGTFSGKCLSACGQDRSFAATTVVITTPARFKHWLAGQESAIAVQNKQAGQIRSELIRQGMFARNAPQ